VLHPEWEELVIIDFHRSAVAAVETIGDRERQFEKWFSDMVKQVSLLPISQSPFV
jgi:hypothetical protein